MGPRNQLLDGGQDLTNPFAAARGDKSAMRPFAKLLWTLVVTFLSVCNWLILFMYFFVKFFFYYNGFF